MLRSTQLIDDPKFVDTHLEHVHDLGILTVAHNPSQQWPQITGASRPMPRPLKEILGQKKGAGQSREESLLGHLRRYC